MAPNRGTLEARNQTTVTSTRQEALGSNNQAGTVAIVIARSGPRLGMERSSPPESASASEDEQFGGVPLAASHDHDMDIDSFIIDQSRTLHHSRHDAQALQSSSGLRPDELHSSTSHDTETPSLTEYDPGALVNGEPSSILTQTLPVNSNTGITSGPPPTVRLDSRTEEFGGYASVSGTFSSSESDFNPEEELASDDDAPTTELSTTEGWDSFFEYFDPDLLESKQNRKANNLSVATFLKTWKEKRNLQQVGYPPDRIDYLPPIDFRIDLPKLGEALRGSVVTTTHLKMEECSFQGFNWKALGTTNSAVQEARRKTYLHHTNLMSVRIFPQYADLNGPARFQRHTKVDGQRWANAGLDMPMGSHDNHLRFRQMNLRCRPQLTHFQLRNMMSASSKNAVFYAGRGEVLCLNPETNTVESIMQLGQQYPEFEGYPMTEVGTLTATHDLLIVGGFAGQYAMKSLLTSNDNDYVKGRITRAVVDGSTNHIHTFLARQSGLPAAVFCSNDQHVRILDCSTDTLIAEHNIGWAINCSVTSPDGRLRLLVGDQTDPWVVAAETGKREVTLPNHQDFGFACDWAPDGLHVATGNQDGIVQIFDCRKWAHPLEVLRTELGGVRTMKFSPLGSGRRVLAMAEPADFVSVVDAETFRSQQRFEFLGEIGGLSFTPEGEKLFVANTDQDFGGILEFDRAGDGQRYGFTRSEYHEGVEGGLVDEYIHLDEEVLHSSRMRKRRRCGFGDVRV